MRAYELRVESNPYLLDLPAVTTVRGRAGRLDVAVRDHLHHLLGTDDVQLVLREIDDGATASAVIGARSGRGGARLTLTLKVVKPAKQTVRECLGLLEASARARLAGDRAGSAHMLSRARAVDGELVLEVGRGIADGTVPKPTDPRWSRYVDTRAAKRSVLD